MSLAEAKAQAQEEGKEYALQQLRLRQKNNAGIKKVNNASLYAGSPMYYYCKICGAVMILPETHTCPTPSLCDKCIALKELGWLE